MRIKKYTIIAFLALYSSIYAQPLIQWDASIGGDSIDFPIDILVAKDNHIVVLSSTFSTNINGYHGAGDILVVKTNYQTGEEIWSRVMGGNGREIGVGLTLLKDGNIIVTAYTNTTIDTGEIKGAHGDWDYWITKLNSETGEIIWSKCYGGDLRENPRKTIQHSDGNIYIVGFTGIIPSSGPYYLSGDITNYFGGTQDVWMIKINPLDGQLIWTKSYGGSPTSGLGVFASDNGYDLIETLDSNMVFAGTTNSFNTGQVSNYHIGVGATTDIWIGKIDTAGNLIGQRSVGGTNTEEWAHIVNTKDGNIVVCGKTASPEGGDIHRSLGSTDYFIFKMDINTMDTLWTWVLGSDGPDYTHDMIIDPMDSSIWVIGSVYPNLTNDAHDAKGEADIWIVNINAQTGDTNWTKSFGTSGRDNNFIQNYDHNAFVNCNGDVIICFTSYTDSIDGDKWEPNYPTQTTNTTVLLKIEAATKNVVWSKTVSSDGPNPDVARIMNEHPLGGIILASDNTVVKANPPGGDKTADTLGYNDSWIVYLNYDTTFFINPEIKLCADTLFFLPVDPDSNRIPAASYYWNFGDTLTFADTSNLNNPDYPFPGPGNYDVTLIKQKECMIDTFIRTIVIPDTPLLEMSDVFICEGNAVDITSPYIANYNWSTGENIKTISLSDTGTYWLELTNGNCLLVDTFLLHYYTQPLFNITPEDTSVFYGDPVTLSVEHGGDTSFWESIICNDCNSVEVIPNKISSYKVTIIDSNGCVYSKTIYINLLEKLIFVPNALVEGRKLNIFGLNKMAPYIFDVFDINGNLIFHSTDPNENWYGYNKNKILQEGVYTYMLSNAGHSYKGNITLVK